MDSQSVSGCNIGMLNEKKLLKELGKRIKAARVSRKLTQEQLAELCEIDPTYVSLLERGLRNPPYVTLCKLADKISCSIEELITQ